MAEIYSLIFNPFQVNTYLFASAGGECAIIDPGCMSVSEQRELHNFIEKQKLRPIVLINTHTHIDHVAGNHYINKEYGLKPVIHRAGLNFLLTAAEMGNMFGLKVDPSALPETFVDHMDKIYVGDEQLEVRYTPGHADGSICLISYTLKAVISGDVLFKRAIGRTDLPSGDFDILEKSIVEQLYSLPDDFKVYSGHGEPTTIGEEKKLNPFISH